MRTRLELALALCLLPEVSFGESFTSSGKGTTAGTFLELGVGGRAMGLGSAYTAVADDATSLYWNPAGLARIERRAATFMHAAYLESSYYDYAAYAQNLGAAGAFGASLQYLNGGSIPETDASFNTVGAFTPNDLALTGGYAHSVEGGAIGASINYIRSEVLQTAQTAAFDAGVISPELLDRRLRLAAGVFNLGGTLKYEQSAESLPTTLKVGAALPTASRSRPSSDASLGIIAHETVRPLCVGIGGSGSDKSWLASQVRKRLGERAIVVCHDARLRALMDLSVFIDVPADVRLIRRVRRDVEHRRVDLEETLRLYEHCVRPMRERFIQPTAEALALSGNGTRIVGVPGHIERQRQRQPLKLD